MEEHRDDIFDREAEAAGAAARDAGEEGMPAALDDSPGIGEDERGDETTPWSSLEGTGPGDGAD